MKSLWCVAIVLVSFSVLAQENLISLTHVSVVDVNQSRLLTDKTITIRGDRILSVSSAKKATPRSANEIDLRGKYVIPGLWDMHVHTAGLNADPKWSRTLLALLVANGVTGIRDMGGDLAALKGWKRKIADGQLIGPEIVASGPMLDSDFKDPNVINVRTPEEARKAVHDLKLEGVDFIKVLSNLDPDVYEAVAKQSKAEGLPFVGHVPPLVGTLEASRAGQKSIEHILYGGFALACSAKADELRPKLKTAMDTGAILKVAEVLDEADATQDRSRCEHLWGILRQNKTWVVPTLVSTYTSAHLDELSKNDSRLAYLPPAFAGAWSYEALAKRNSQRKLDWYKRQVQIQSQLVLAMHAHGVRILAGTDSLDPHNIPGHSLHKELRLLTEAGFPANEALSAATTNPAEFLHRAEFGAVQKGRRADLVILDADPLADIKNTEGVFAVVLRGRYLDRAKLNELLESARAEASGAQE
jgi:imidazolonepropionase-like amidohydrolase